MKTKLTHSFAVILLLTLALTGCRTTRSTEDAAKYSRKQRNELLIPLTKYPADVQVVSAKTSIILDYNGISATLKGRLRMRRDEVVQITITALGLMEIASVEFTPKGACLIDRVNKRYAVIDFSTMRMNYAGINFSAVQALFWNRLFLPSVDEAWRAVEDFTLSNTGSQYVIEPERQRVLKCKFYADADCKQLQQTDLALQQYAATWRYGQFEAIGSYCCPTMYDVSVSGSSRAIGARIELTNVSALDTGWNGTTDLSRYKEVDLEQLLSIIDMLK